MISGIEEMSASICNNIRVSYVILEELTVIILILTMKVVTLVKKVTVVMLVWFENAISFLILQTY